MKILTITEGEGDEVTVDFIEGPVESVPTRTVLITTEPGRDEEALLFEIMEKNEMIRTAVLRLVKNVWEGALQYPNFK
jgi:hypothetical protein